MTTAEIKNLITELMDTKPRTPFVVLQVNNLNRRWCGCFMEGRKKELKRFKYCSKCYGLIYKGHKCG